MRLGINVDHVATVRQARGVEFPDPVEAAVLAVKGGADGITVHLREDRRHIQERDVGRLREKVKNLNLEMAATGEMAVCALRYRPDDVCLVPERRQELTTEGGLDVAAHPEQIQEVVRQLRTAGIRANLFVDPDPRQIQASLEVGAHGIEIHTGAYSNADEPSEELHSIENAAAFAAGLGLEVHAGHGLHVANVAPIAAIPEIVELNIGHSIVSRAIMIGMEAAVREMKDRITESRGKRQGV